MIYEIIFRTVFFYIFIVFVLRILGKREIGELGIFDLIVLLVIADIAVIAIEDIEKPFWLFVISILIIAFIEKIGSYFSLKSHRFRNIVEGKDSIIILNGKLNINEMRKQLYNVNDLVTQMRSKGYRCVSQIEYAILETSGELNIFPYQNINTSSNKIFPIPLIISQVVQKECFRLFDVPISIIENIDIKQVYFASVDKDFNIFIAEIL